MADHLSETEPVLDAAKIVATVNGVVGGLATIAVVTGLLTEGQASELVTAVGAIVTAGAALVGVVLPIVQGFKARAKVTPLAAPRALDGTPLVPTLDH